MEENLRQRAKTRLLRVTMPDGEVLCFDSSKQTYLEALRKIGSGYFPRINFVIKGHPILSKEIVPRYKKFTEEVCDGWYVIIMNGTDEKYRQLLIIADQLVINMKVEIGDDFITTKTQKKQTRKKRDSKLLVKFPDGNYVAGENPIDTFLEAIWTIGPNFIKQKGIEYQEKPVITYSKIINNQIQVGKDYWVIVPGTTNEKCKLLRFLSSKMKLGLEVNVI